MAPLSRAAVERSSWPVRVFRLGEEPAENLTGTTTVAERLSMMWPLALEAWMLSRRPLPDYGRGETPVTRRGSSVPRTTR